MSDGPATATRASGPRSPTAIGFLGFVDRIGLAVVDPRARLERGIEGEPGLGDVAWLLVLKILVGETPRIARALIGASKLGLGVALQGLLQAASAVLPDVLAILVGGVLLSLLGGGRAAKGRETDLAATAWIPYFAVRLFSALVFTALQRMESPVEDHLIDAIAVCASAYVFALTLARMRRPTDDETRSAAPGLPS